MMDPVCDVLDGRISEHVSSFEGTSQYTQGGTSTCGLAALNAVRIILGQEKRGIKNLDLLRQIASKPLIEEVVAICATWSSQLHLEVDDIIGLPLFETTLSLSFSEYNQAEPKHFTTLLRRLQEAGGTSSSSRVSSAVVITRPPEILAVFCIPTDFINCPNVFVVFDSHPRPAKGAKGTSFIFFSTLEAASRYISSLLQVDPNLLSGLGDLQWQAQLLGHYSGHVFLARNSHDFDTNPMRPIYDANMDVLEFKSRLAESSEKIRDLTTENETLRARLTQLEGALKSQTKLGGPRPRVPSSLQTWKHSRSPSPVAGPSTSNVRNREGHSRSFTPRYDNNRDSYPARRQKGSLDDTLATQLLEEQEDELASFQVALHTQREMDREDKELRSQMRQLQKKAQVLFKCAVCLDKHPEDFVAQVETCEHRLCRDCMKNFVTSKLEENRYPILCPICQLDNNNTKDPGVITRNVVEQLGFTESQQAIWIELELSELSVSLDCPKCRRCTFVDIGDHTDMKLLQCPLPDCRHEWCKLCQRPVEMGKRHSCDGTLELDDLIKSRGWKYCPGCTTPTEKQSGCNHMTCIARGCNTHFCYVCGQNIVRSVRRGEIKSALNAHYTRCSLFEDVPDRNG